MRRLILAVLLLPLSARAGKRFESFTIDRVDMTPLLSGPVGLMSTDTAWYERSETASGARVEDFRDGGSRGVFDFGGDGRLLHRSRALAVLDGRFGRVYARFDCWYPPEKPRVAVNTGAAKRNLPHREAVAGAASKAAPDSFALIRVLKAKDKFKIATADYGLDGGLRALRVEVSSGDWTSTEVVASTAPAAAAEWGLPAAVDAATFAVEPFAGSEPWENLETEAALTYRARGTIVERATRRGSRVDRDWLSFPLTEVERALSRTEAAFPFTPGPGR